MIKSLTTLILLFTLASCASRKPAPNTQLSSATTSNTGTLAYEGGDGKTMETAVIIRNARNSTNGIAAEYAYIAKLHGEKFKDWKTLGQSTSKKGNHMFDVLKVQLAADNSTLTYYFDITDFYGKF